MFKLAMFMFSVMTFGYIFGRIQQYNIDDLIPVLFIVEKDEKDENGENIISLRIINGIWVKNEDSEDNGNGLLIPSDEDYSMFFAIESSDLEGKSVSVNNVTSANMNDLNENNKPTLTFTAYATQYYSTNNTAMTPQSAWDAVKSENTGA